MFLKFFICTFNASKVSFIHFLFEWQIACSLYGKNRVNGCQIFGWFGFLKTKSESNFGFPHIPRLQTEGVLS